MDITFLGTSSMVPTKERNVQSIHCVYEDTHFLIDCGEGTQRQMNLADINRNKIDNVLITHWHGDHVSGLIGLIQTIGSNMDEKTIRIYGPEGTEERMHHLLQSCHFSLNIDLEIHEVSQGTIIDTDEYEVRCKEMEHGVPCVAYSIVEKDYRKMLKSELEKRGLNGPIIGKLQSGETVTVDGESIHPDDVSEMMDGRKATFILDTSYTKDAVDLAKDSDLLVTECTYLNELREKAKEYNHLTTRQAGKIAKESGSDMLVITHFSQRYRDEQRLVEEVEDVFPNVEGAKDFMRFSVTKDKTVEKVT